MGNRNTSKKEITGTVQVKTPGIIIMITILRGLFLLVLIF